MFGLNYLYSLILTLNKCLEEQFWSFIFKQNNWGCGDVLYQKYLFSTMTNRFYGNTLSGENPNRFYP